MNMSWFKSEVDADEDEPVPAPEHDQYWVDHVNELVEQAHQEALSEFDERDAQNRKYQKDRKSGFKFDCTRFGDFLQININDGHTKYAETLNLTNTQSIKLEGGKPANRAGILSVGVTFINDRDPAGMIHSLGYDEYLRNIGGAPPKYHKYISLVDWPNPPEMGLMPHYKDKEKYGLEYRRLRDTDFYRTKFFEGCPSSSVDDTIHFIGTDFVIPVPYGMGQKVVDKIHATIKDGYEAVDLDKIK